MCVGSTNNRTDLEVSVSVNLLLQVPKVVGDPSQLQTHDTNNGYGVYVFKR
jgi:hypothetical protein